MVKPVPPLSNGLITAAYRGHISPENHRCFFIRGKHITLNQCKFDLRPLQKGLNMWDTGTPSLPLAGSRGLFDFSFLKMVFKRYKILDRCMGL